MAGDDGRRCSSHRTAAVILVLCCLAQSLTCFSLTGLSKKIKQNEVESGATVTKLRTGSILLNGKGLNSKSGSTSATGNDGLLHTDGGQLDGSEMLEQTSQLGDNMADEAAMRRLNPSLHCGQSKMKLKAMGPGAANLQLDMGNARPLPLIQVPETCGYSMHQNALGLVLVVPYDGCNVIQEDGSYVLPLRWLGTPVKLTCPMSINSSTTPASTSPKPAPQLGELPFPPWAQNLNRHKRQARPAASYYDPRSAYYYYLYYYYYYMHMMTATTTAKPGTTTVTTKPTTQKPLVYPYNPYYPYGYYPYYHHYPYYYPLPNLPVKTTTASPTTGPVTTGPVTTGMTTAKLTTTASASTIKTPKIPPYPYYPFYPFYIPPGQTPGAPFYYPFVQNFYGRPPYLPTTQPPTLTTIKPGETVKPSSPTTKPTTASDPTAKTTTTTTTTKKPDSGVYPGPLSPYVPYDQLPFEPYISYNKARKLPIDEKYMPQAGYKSGLGAQAHPHPGFNYWQPVPWFPHSMGKDDLQLDWKLPKRD